MRWNIFNGLVAAKEKLCIVSLGPLLNLSVKLLQIIISVFQVKQQEFRNRLKNEVIFRFDAEDPYTCIDKVKHFFPNTHVCHGEH